jgi:3-phenylpropionate/trans-cinnamate dioxygenase ferredoxin reductase component
MRRILIVGAGLAGHRAAQALRRDGFDGELTIVGDEVHEPYDRPPLSKQLLAGTMEHADCFFASDELNLQWLLGQPATALDTERRMVTLAGGDEVPYDGLVIATGRRAREWPDLPDIEGFYMLRGRSGRRSREAPALRSSAPASSAARSRRPCAGSASSR